MQHGSSGRGGDCREVKNVGIGRSLVFVGGGANNK